ncbi:DNA-binding response regulator, NarL/FixJ family, contains REC and HTH domains [Amycolatopsis xylanica]|uniref:DNA-binding response regulator, NarL/FixJ family, contains REC and HTH domains n=1 Tax=Amycolatopsis xylanica TaxID=589385 RepID=A0A1H3SQI3_9PSEU|nr:response regulator transcription factor [Amycolatopsis xylanica]SDZ39977.1 DNA-binding response regulator, NarL/FixJ family, contains REC and HTH domains [Amycolatopsis xylanica]
MRVVMVEDNVLLAEGMRHLLQSAGHELLARVEDADSFVEAVREHRPDVSIVDVRLPPTFSDEGIHAALRARREVAGTPVLVLSQYVEETYAGELLSDGNGGVGYLLKDRVARIEEFLEALERVASGGTAMDPEVIAQLLTRKHDPLAALTAREREVLHLMAQGFANGEIATKLVVTERAVQKHVGNIFSKLDLPASESGHRRVLAVLAYLE